MKRYVSLIEANVMKPYQTKVGSWGVYDGTHYHYFDDQEGAKNFISNSGKIGQIKANIKHKVTKKSSDVDKNTEDHSTSGLDPKKPGVLYKNILGNYYTYTTSGKRSEYGSKEDIIDYIKSGDWKIDKEKA